MNLNVKNVPYRKYGKNGRIVVTKEGKRAFDLAMKHHAAGYAVDMRIAVTGHPVSVGQTYETISFTVQD